MQNERTCIQIEKKNKITTIIISRPHVKNAIDKNTAEQLKIAFENFEKDNSSNVAVLYGNHGTFCSGADLKSLSEKITMNLVPVNEGPGPLGPTRMILSKPTIAAISGYAVAGGLELALFCDLRIMEEDSIVGVFCRRWGVPLIDGGTVRLPRLIGLSRALDLILTGRPVNAKEALSMGLANKIVPHGCARQEAEKLADMISNFPQTCLREDRMSVYEQFGLSFQDALQNEFQHGLKTIYSGETIKGASQFTKGEGRHGSFQNFQSKL